MVLIQYILPSDRKDVESLNVIKRSVINVQCATLEFLMLWEVY